VPRGHCLQRAHLLGQLEVPLHRPLTGQVRSGQVRSGQVRSGQVRSGQVRSGQVRSGLLPAALHCLLASGSCTFRRTGRDTADRNVRVNLPSRLPSRPGKVLPADSKGALSEPAPNMRALPAGCPRALLGARWDRCRAHGATGPCPAGAALAWHHALHYRHRQQAYCGSASCRLL
jgi:hypothetical protein